MWRVICVEYLLKCDQIMPVTRETFGTYMSRLGYLPQDQNMDEGFNISKYHKLHKFVNNHVVLSQAW